MPSGMMRSGVVDVINKGPARIRHNLKIQLLFFKIISLICWLGPGSSTGQRVNGLLKPLGNQPGDSEYSQICSDKLLSSKACRRNLSFFCL